MRLGDKTIHVEDTEEIRNELLRVLTMDESELNRMKEFLKFACENIDFITKKEENK